MDENLKIEHVKQSTTGYDSSKTIDRYKTL